MSAIAIVGCSAVGALVVGWLVVSFSAPGHRREVVEWASAAALYLALFMLFTHLGLRARAEDNTALLIAFGFLWLLFGGGLAVSLFEILRSARRTRATQTSATN